jgi:hypothetical protein
MASAGVFSETLYVMESYAVAKNAVVFHTEVFAVLSSSDYNRRTEQYVYALIVDSCFTCSIFIYYFVFSCISVLGIHNRVRLFW